MSVLEVNSGTRTASGEQVRGALCELHGRDGFGGAASIPAASRAGVGRGPPNEALAHRLQYVLIVGSEFGRRPE